MKPVVLLVDDERVVTEAMKQALRGEPFEVVTAGSAMKTMEILAQRNIDVIVADERMPGMSGNELLTFVRQKYPDTVRIMLTGCATLETAVRAINEGEIHRFFTKPFDQDELAMSIRMALEHRQLTVGAKQVMRALESGLDWNETFHLPER